MGFGDVSGKSLGEQSAETRSISEHRIERARRLNQQPWGRFLLGVVIRVAITFGVALAAITLFQYLRG